MINISEKQKFWPALIVCVGLYAAHFVNILKYAVNIPFYDEWEAVTPSGFIANPTLQELFSQHNEHRIVTTKLLTLLLYQVDGWNNVTHQALNFVIYGLLIVVLAYIIKKCVPQLPGWVLLCFIVFLLSTVNWENHFWAFQTQFHFSLLFLLLSIWFLFNENQEWHKITVGIFFSWLAIYSLSSGLVEIVAVLLGYSCFKLLRIRQSDGGNRFKEILELAAALALIGGAIGLYFVGYVKPQYHPPLALPYQRIFWEYFLNLLSGGFGYVSQTKWPGSLIFLFVLAPVLGEIWKRRFQLTPKTWIIIISIIAVLASLSSITMGRANFGVGQSKSSRYAEIIQMLIPLSVAMWVIFLDNYKNGRYFVLAAFWIFCVISFLTFWNFSRPYSMASQGKNKGLECVRNFYLNGGDGNCPTIYPVPIADRLEFDRTLKLSFVKEINK